MNTIKENNERNTSNSILKFIFLGSMIFFNLEYIVIYFIVSFEFINPFAYGNLVYLFLVYDILPLIITISLILVFKYKVGVLLEFKDKWFLVDICFTSIVGSGVGILLFSYIINPLLNNLQTGRKATFFPNILEIFISLLFQSVLYGLDFSFLLFFAYFINNNELGSKKNDDMNIFHYAIFFLPIIILSFLNVFPQSSYLHTYYLYLPTIYETYSILILYPITTVIMRFIIPGLVFYLLIHKFKINFHAITGKKLTIIFSLTFIGSSIPFLLQVLLYYKDILINPDFFFLLYATQSLQIVFILFAVFTSFIYILNVRPDYVSNKTQAVSNYKPLFSKFKKAKKEKPVTHETDVYLKKIEEILIENE